MPIDLRSDTLTTPSAEMREAMVAAPVGDDVYGEDATVNKLQNTVAEMFGKEAALFVPSGTMGNQICLAIQTQSADEIIADADAHIFHYENAAASVIARVQINGLKSKAGEIPINEISTQLRPPAYYYPRTSLIAVENTHNRHGGTVLSMEYLGELKDFATQANLPVHCDGARIWNAMAATGASAWDMGAHFSTMSVCFSKGLGAPVGSAILGTRENIEKARRWRKMLGGGMRQSGVLAAAALYALDNVLPLLKNDHASARRFAEGIQTIPGIEVELDTVQTNVVMFRVPGMSDDEFVTRLKENGVVVGIIKPGVLRAVFYYQLGSADCDLAIGVIRKTMQS